MANGAEPAARGGQEARAEPAARGGQEAAGSAKAAGSAADVSAGPVGVVLDELLEQVRDRIRAMKRSQRRLRCLLQANLEIATAVDLEAVLHHILTAGRELVEARYAALGVVRDGQLVRFLHSGIEPDQVARIGDLPQGKGVLGVLVDDPRPVRLPDIAEHPAAVGFPAHHPPMRTFLGVPIRVRNEVFGNLYLTEKRNGERFTHEDEQLACGVAAAAGIAIANATLFAESSRHREWLAAMVGVATQLLAGGQTEDALCHLVHRVCSASGGDGGAFGVVSDDRRHLRMIAAHGELAPWSGDLLPLAGSLAESVLSGRDIDFVPDPLADPRTADLAARDPSLGPMVAVPVVGESRVRGVLLLTRKVGRESFSRPDHDMVSAIADQAALVLELAESRRVDEKVQRLGDRERIAVDLQRRVIRRLFAFGLSLQALAGRAPTAEMRAALEEKVAELDHIIHDTRDAVFDVDHPPPGVLDG